MPKGIGRRIRQAREEAGLTQADLAGKLGVSFQAIQQLERGEIAIIHRLKMIAEILKIEPHWLLTGRDGVKSSAIVRRASAH